MPKHRSNEDQPASAEKVPARKRWTVRILAILLSLLLAEGLLRLLCYVSPEVDLALSPPSKFLSLTLVVPDARLKYRGNPQIRAEHDPLGFRNPQLSTLPESMAVVALGDSQTYGTSVDWRQAWPQQFGRQAGLATYNMGCSGWGPVEYRETLADALKFKPKLVIVGLYFGNDLFDAYRDSYFLPTGVDLCDPKQHDAIHALEQKDPFLPKIEKLYKATMEPAEPAHEPKRGANADRDLAQKMRATTANSPAESQPAAPDSQSEAPIDRYGKLAALANSTWRVVSGLKTQSDDEQWQHTLSWVKERPNDLIVVENGRFRTILTPAYRGIAVDRNDLRIVEGERITQKILEQMAERCQQAGCELLVVLIPTKETVYADMAGDAVSQIDYAKLLQNEQQALDVIKKFLTEHEIPFVETLEPLRQCFAENVNPYLPSADGHPSAFGQRAIATAIAAHPLVQKLK